MPPPPNDPANIDVTLTLLGANSQNSLEGLIEQLKAVSSHLENFAQQEGGVGDRNRFRNVPGAAPAVSGAGVSETATSSAQVGQSDIGHKRGLGPDASVGTSQGPITGDQAEPVTSDTPFADVLRQQREAQTTQGQPPISPFEEDLRRLRPETVRPAGVRARFTAGLRELRRGRQGDTLFGAYGPLGRAWDAASDQAPPGTDRASMVADQADQEIYGGAGGGIAGQFRQARGGIAGQGEDPSVGTSGHYLQGLLGQEMPGYSALHLGQRVFQRYAQGGEGETIEDPSRIWASRAANTLGSSAAMYAEYYPAARMLMGRLDRTGAGAFLHPGRLENQGADLGYERGGGMGVGGPGGIGFEPPWNQYASPAGRAAMQAHLEEANLRLMPNINREQSNQIVNGLMEQGWSGGTMERMAYQSTAPFVQQYGTGALPEFQGLQDQSLRYGTANIDQFNKTMQNIGDAAQKANMPLGQFIQSMGEFASAAQQHGATFTQGLQGAREWTTSTGLSPQIGAQQMQSPMIQGLAMGQYGMLPSQIGLLGGTGMANLTGQAIQMAGQMTAGFNRPVQEGITDASGKVVGHRTISGTDMQDAQAASLLGMNIDTYKRMKQTQQQTSRLSNAQNALAAWSHNAAHQGSGLHGRAADAAMAQGAGGISWHEMAVLAGQAGVSQKEIQSISHEHSTKQRYADMQRALAKHTPSVQQNKGATGPVKVDISFKGAAEKLFKATVQSGGNPVSGLIHTGEGIASNLLNDPVNTAIHTGEHILNALNPLG